MIAESRRLKVLVSAYACEPGKGSEPGVGWAWATRMGEYHDVTVLTRANNRDAIEEARKKIRDQPACQFLYYDLGRPWLFLKGKGLLPVPFYYLLWQLGAAALIRRANFKFSIIHHVTFNAFRFPGAWWGMKGAGVVLGPLGGGALAEPAFRRAFGRKWWLEYLRALSLRFWKLNPWTRRSFSTADALIFVSDDMVSQLQPEHHNIRIMLETGLDAEIERVPVTTSIRREGFVWIGTLEPWKNWRLALEAYARAFPSSAKRPPFTFIGTGRELQRARVMAGALGLSDAVIFAGRKPRNAVYEALRSSRALIFSSVRDTSGNVILESMALGCPVVCFNHQGAGMITDDLTAIRVEPSTWDAAIVGFSLAMQRLASDDALVGALGEAGFNRANQCFSWGAKILAMSEIYSRVATTREAEQQFAVVLKEW